ncbi:hypothetical protein CK203_047640 [Vitis vinifera]|uniref:C-JID domain-containing protein n=1 Tax=Vitis vinifera TaxID=29760 RepID=A0A438H5S7_VITVI|nr:hypothetical protein CK203_047640 [Vitis vinifera]
MGHTSLEAFSYPSSANALKESRFNFYFCNCFRLVGNEQSDGVEAILEFGLLHQDRNPWLQYNVVVPGSSSIPEWFIHQSAGYLVPVELPPHWYNTKLKGLAFVLFSTQTSPWLTTSGLVIDHLSTSLGSGGPFRNQSNTLKVSFSVSNSDGEGVKKCGVRVVYEQDEKDGECIFPFWHHVARRRR